MASSAPSDRNVWYQSGQDVSLTHVPAQEEQEELQQFVRSYAKQLQDFDNALEETISDAWDFAMDPIALDIEPYEQMCIVDMVQTENKFFNKIIMAFAGLCKEAGDMEKVAYAKYYPPLSIYGELHVDQDPTDGDSEMHLANCFDLFSEVNDFVGHLNRMVRNFVQQLASLYSNSKAASSMDTFKAVHLPTVMSSFGRLLGILITLDEIITQNDSLSQSWSSYKKMMFVISRDPDRFSVEEESLRSVERLLREFERTLLGHDACGGVLLQNAINQNFEVQGLLQARGNKVFLGELLNFLKTSVEHFGELIGSKHETDEQERVVGCVGLYALYRRLSDDSERPEKKIYQQIWELQKKMPVLLLYGNAVWVLPDFLCRHCPLNVSVSPKDVTKSRIEFLTKHDKNFILAVQHLYLRVCAWMVRMESDWNSHPNSFDILSFRVQHLLRGVVLGRQIGLILKQSLMLHLLHPDVHIPQENVASLAQCAEMMKSVQFMFHRKSQMIGDSLPHLVRQLAASIQQIARAAKSRFEERYRLNDPSTFDRLAAMELIERVLDGAVTGSRVIILRLALSVARMDSKDGGVMTKEEVPFLLQKVKDLEQLCCLSEVLERVSNCDFMYWCRSLNPAYFQQVLNNPERGQKLQYLVAAMQDTARLLSKAKHQPANEFALKFRQQLESQLDAEIIEPLCREVENDLRMHTHMINSQANATGQITGQTVQVTNLRDLSRIFTLRPIRLFDKVIDFAGRVGHYLDQTFYNLNTVAPHDWKIYTQMRNLAREKYGLDLTEVHLPSATLEQGLDMLEIMRNIHKFVQVYVYNLNNQHFIERHSDHKHLHTISIRHIANSIRTHGTGVMSTTVNFVYQFLTKKFSVYSQFLFDDEIASRLVRDIQYFTNYQEPYYPYERAIKFNEDIWKLGKSGGLSYLDRFRMLISEMGNALGFVRMVRSGGLQFLSGAIKFVPDLENIQKFDEACQDEKLSHETVTAAANMDSAISHLTKNFAEGSDYFKKLVHVFEKMLNVEDQKHLQNFWIAVPPLCLNYVNYITGMKERLSSSGKPGGKATCYTDDGFAIGLAFILRVLDQWEQFDSLHWFNTGRKNGSVAQHFKLDAQLLEKRYKDKGERNKLSREEYEHRMKLNRRSTLEMELLGFSISSARVFFLEKPK